MSDLMNPGPVANQSSTTAPIHHHGTHDHRVADPLSQRIWDHVSHSPIHNLWDLQGVPVRVLLKRTGCAFLDDNLISRAAELGYYFLFALFPMLISASSLLGIAAKHASAIYMKLLNYFALVVPHSAYQMVIQTFNQTTRASTSGKVTFGLIVALYTASVGFSSIQDGMNTVYRIKDSRPYWKARLSAILVTLILGIITTLDLAVLFAGDYLAGQMREHFWHRSIGLTIATLLHIATWAIAFFLLMLLFSVIYYFAPDLKVKKWHWLTPGGAIGIVTWILASLGLRIYLHYFNNYTLTYGSLGAVIILLMWFYITALTLLLGAEVNSEIHAIVTEKQLKESGELPPQARALPE